MVDVSIHVVGNNRNLCRTTKMPGMAWLFLSVLEACCSVCLHDFLLLGFLDMRKPTACFFCNLKKPVLQPHAEVL